MQDEITPDSLLEKIARAPMARPVRPAMIPDRYEVRGVLGEGGFGVVYDVLDKLREERVALKTLHRVVPDALLRFKREFRTLVDLRHENLVRLHELGGEGSNLWFTMERLEAAQPFESWLAGAPARLRPALGQLASGLAALHAEGILHRDLKSSNVLVEPDGRVVLLDFGLAREVTADGSTQLAGTPLFMAPEQCAEAELTSAVDLYALGVMLFHALTGRYPFEGRAVQVMVAKQSDGAPPLRTLAPEVPGDLARLVDQLLAIEPRERPSAADVLDLFGAAPDRAPRSEAEPLSEPFVGRDDELAQLHAIVRSRRGALVRVEGVSGIGKTALLDRLCAELDDAWVLRGRCHPRESVRYKAFDEVVDQLARKLSKHPDAAALLPRDTAALQALFPVLASVCPTPRAEGEVDRAAGLSALRELFARLADRTTVVLAIDDLQWGDADSARLFVELLRQPDAPRLTIVATAREGDAGALVEQLETLVDADVEVRHERLHLGPLRGEHAVSLAARLTGDDERAEVIARASSGHPLFLTELARHDDEDDVDLLIQRRVDATDETARAVLEVVALAGHLLDEAVIARAIGRPAGACIERLSTTHLLRVSPSGVRVYHDRIAELLVDGIGVSRQGELHRRIAESLVLDDGDPEQIAAHFDAAGDPRARAHTVEAAHRAMQGLAYRNAAGLYERALELGSESDRTPRQTYNLVRGRARALKAAGQARDAAEAFLRAASVAPVDEQHAHRTEAGRLLVLGGHVDRAADVFNALLDDLGIRFPRSASEATARIAAERARGWLRGRFSRRADDPQRLARLDALWGVYYGMMFTRPLLGLAAAVMYLSEAKLVASPKYRFIAVCIEAFLETFRDGAAARDPAIARVNAAFADLELSHDDDARLERAIVVANIQYFGLDIRGSIAGFKEALAIATQTHHGWDIYGITVRGLISSAYFVLGDLPHLRRLAPALVIESNERDQLLVWVLVAYHHWWVRAVQQGSDYAADRARAEIAERWRSRGNEMQDWWEKIGQLNIALVAGEPRKAYENISQNFAEALAMRALSGRLHYLEGRLFIARAAVALAAVDEAQRDKLLRVAAEIQSELRSEPSAFTLALSLGIEAGIASIADDDERTVRVLEALEPAATAAGLVMLAAVVQEELCLRVGDDELGAKAAATRADGALESSVHAARVLLPGRFIVNGALDP